MRGTQFLVVALTAAGSAFGQADPACGQENAPQANRQAAANLIRDALVPEAAKAKIEGTAADRHKEVIKNPIKDIVTYWRSEVSGSATFVEPDKKMTVEVSTLIRTPGKSTVTVNAKAPVKGNVSGRATTDNGKQIVAVASPFTCNLGVTAECVVTRVERPDGVAYKVEVTKWDPTVADLRFDNGLDRVKGPIEKLANDKLKGEADKLKDKMNDALRKAYQDGRLTLPN